MNGSNELDDYQANLQLIQDKQNTCMFTQNEFTKIWNNWFVPARIVTVKRLFENTFFLSGWMMRLMTSPLRDTLYMPKRKTPKPWNKRIQKWTLFFSFSYIVQVSQWLCGLKWCESRIFLVHEFKSKWAVIDETERSMGIELESPQYSKWTDLCRMVKSKRPNMDGIQKWMVHWSNIFSSPIVPFTANDRPFLSL